MAITQNLNEITNKIATGIPVRVNGQVVDGVIESGLKVFTISSNGSLKTVPNTASSAITISPSINIETKTEKLTKAADNVMEWIKANWQLVLLGALALILLLKRL